MATRKNLSKNRFFITTQHTRGGLSVIFEDRPFRYKDEIDLLKFQTLIDFHILTRKREFGTQQFSFKINGIYFNHAAIETCDNELIVYSLDIGYCQEIAVVPLSAIKKFTVCT